MNRNLLCSLVVAIWALSVAFSEAALPPQQQNLERKNNKDKGKDDIWTKIKALMITSKFLLGKESCVQSLNEVTLKVNTKNIHVSPISLRVSYKLSITFSYTRFMRQSSMYGIKAGKLKHHKMIMQLTFEILITKYRIFLAYIILNVCWKRQREERRKANREMVENRKELLRIFKFEFL